MVKPRSATAAGAKVKQEIPDDKVNDLIESLADKPYGEPAKRGPGRPRKTERVPKPRPVTVSLPDTMIERLEDLARKNKRKNKKELKTISAIVRDALEARGYGEPPKDDDAEVTK